MLKLLANENVQSLLVSRLRERGHDVRWVLEERRGIADPQVLRQALTEGRVLLTWDKDFGDVVYRQGKSASNGIVLLRVTETRSQADVVRIVLPVLETHTMSWPGHFSVIDRSRVRIRPLP